MDNERNTIGILSETCLILFGPLLVCKFLSLVRVDRLESWWLYVSAVIAVASATVAITSLTRLELVWRKALAVFAVCVITILVLTADTFRAGSRDFARALASTLFRSPDIGSHIAQSANVFCVDIALIASGWCLSQMFARGVKRPSYLALAAVAATIADTYSVWWGFTRKVVEEHADTLSTRAFLQWFVIGDPSPRAVMGIGDLLFLGLFLWGARRFNFDLRVNVLAQIVGLMIAYAIVIGWQKPIAGLIFIGPVFIAVNWKRFDISPHDWRAMACLVAGLLIAVVALILLGPWISER